MPTASMATSTPRLPVSCITFSTAFLLLMPWVAPSFFATSRRFSSRSMTMISDGEWSCAVSSAESPTGPAPTMATVSPGLTAPLRTPHS